MRVYVSKAVRAMLCNFGRGIAVIEIVCDREDRDVIEDTPKWSREKEHKK